MSMKRPVRGTIYTLHEICHDLFLRDSPFLRFTHDGRDGVVQDSHMGDDLTNIPNFGDTCWRYVRETEEWIPLFDYVGSHSDPSVPKRELTEFLDLEPLLDFAGVEIEDSWWATPKGHPREQYVE